MDLMYRGPNNIIKYLIDLGVKGHFPLFDSEALQEAHREESGKKILTKKDQLRGKEIIKKLEHHRSVDRQKDMIDNLHIDDRKILIRVFIKIVERKIIDQRPQLQ